MGKLILRADGPESKTDRKNLVTAGLESGITRFVLRKGDEDFESLGRIDVFYTVDGKICDTDCEEVSIDNPDDQKYAMSLAGKKPYVVVSTSDWKVIPFENLVASFAGTESKILAFAEDCGEIDLFRNIMEKGIDGIIVAPNGIEDVAAISSKFSTSADIGLSEIVITSVKPAGMGDRVCVDTCSIMVPGEGMLVGSYSDCLFLVQSESEDSGYVASRPFRVNAGAVHCYVEAPEGRTRYLSEISSGETVLLCDSKGMTRTATVGRCKIEKRPLVMVAATDGSREYSVMLQNAETIKLVTEGGSVSVTSLKIGDRVLAKLGTGGRHFGMPVDETVCER